MTSNGFSSGVAEIEGAVASSLSFSDAFTGSTMRIERNFFRLLVICTILDSGKDTQRG